MKIIAVVGDGSNQRALAHRLHQAVGLAHVARISPRPSGRRKLIRSAVSLTLARGLRRAWFAMLRHYDEQYADWPAVPASSHHSANAAAVIELVERERPDLVLVSGTDLLKAGTLQRFATRVMNLHTGISPYLKGAPNCTNWALALGDFDLIGNTVMWIDPGIDSGAIVATERTPLTGRETLTELHLKVMEHAHDLYVRAVIAFCRGDRLPSVAQSTIAPGRLLLTRDWNSAAMIRAVLNHRFRYRPFSPRPGVKLVSIDAETHQH